MVAVAMVVGAGIFRSPADIAANTGSAFWFFGAWIAGGLITLAGAFCFAELATMLPQRRRRLPFPQDHLRSWRRVPVRMVALRDNQHGFAGIAGLRARRLRQCRVVIGAAWVIVVCAHHAGGDDAVQSQGAVHRAIRRLRDDRPSKSVASWWCSQPAWRWSSRARRRSRWIHQRMPVCRAASARHCSSCCSPSVAGARSPRFPPRSTIRAVAWCAR